MRKLGLRRYFVGSALFFATLGWLQSTMPSLPILLMMRAFEGFTTGGFGPRTLLAVFLFCKGQKLRAFPAVSGFLLVLVTLVVAVAYMASESPLGIRGMALSQVGLGSLLVLAGLRWLPRLSEAPPVGVPAERSAIVHHGATGFFCLAWFHSRER